MIVQRRPEGLAEGECRYRSSEYEEGRQSWGRNAHAKQPGCRAKVINYSVLAWCHFGGKSWYEFYLPMVVKLYVKTRCKYGEKVYMWIMMIGWHMFQVVSCLVIVIWLVSWCWKVNDAGGKRCWSTSASILQNSSCVFLVVVGCCSSDYCWWASFPPATLCLS